MLSTLRDVCEKNPYDELQVPETAVEKEVSKIQFNELTGNFIIFVNINRFCFY